MADNNVSMVTTGAPQIGGYAYRAPAGTTLPKNATETLNEAFKSIGYISDEGVVNANSPESEDIKDWGGTTVLSVQSSKDDTFQFTLLESVNLEVLRMVYGADNVTETEDTITIKANNAETEEAAYVLEMVLRGGQKKRVVLPKAKVTDVGDITYTKSDPVGYQVTLTCTMDEEGNTHYEYITKKKTAA